MFLYELRENLIEKNIYINDELTIEEQNIFKLYHLNLETNNKFIMKFSSNYPLDDYFSVLSQLKVIWILTIWKTIQNLIIKHKLEKCIL